MMKAPFRPSSGGAEQNGAMRRLLPAWLAVSIAAPGVLLADAPPRRNGPTVVQFLTVRPGTLPAGFLTLTSAEKERGRWEVVRLGRHHALSQLDAGRDGYRLAVLESPRLGSLRAGTRLRLGERGDRAAGLAWRVQDAGSYYAARLDLATNEFVLYKFVRGNRVRLARLAGLRLEITRWHELAVEHVGDRIRAWLNGIPVADERDAALAEPGMVGFWLPGDSTAHFERLWYEPVVE